MNELNEGYTIAQKYTHELNQGERELSKIEDKIQAISERAEDLRNQYLELEQAKSERENMADSKVKKRLTPKLRTWKKRINIHVIISSELTKSLQTRHIQK